jgi:hypothetical protein
VKRRHWLVLAALAIVASIAVASVALGRATGRGGAALMSVIFERVEEAYDSLEKADIVVDIIEVPPDRVAVSACARQSHQRVDSLEALPTLAPHITSPTVAIAVSGPSDTLSTLTPAVEAAVTEVRHIMLRRGAPLPKSGYTIRFQTSAGSRPTSGCS